MNRTTAQASRQDTTKGRTDQPLGGPGQIIYMLDGIRLADNIIRSHAFTIAALITCFCGFVYYLLRAAFGPGTKSILAPILYLIFAPWFVSQVVNDQVPVVVSSQSQQAAKAEQSGVEIIDEQQFRKRLGRK